MPISGLSPSRVSQIDIYTTPKGAQTRAFGNVLLLGSTPGVIDISEGYRTYNSPDDVLNDFGLTAPEAKAAQIFFSQVPTPLQLFIGFFAQTPTAAVLHGGLLPASARLMSNFNSITNGAFNLTIDSVNRSVGGINLVACTNLSMVAAAVTASLTPYASCTWDGQKFNLMSASTGITSALGYASAPTSGTDLSTLLYLAQGLTTGAPVNGASAESPIAAVLRYANLSTDWYALRMAPVTPLSVLDRINIAAFIEGAQPSRIFATNTSDSNEFVPNNGLSLGSQLAQLNYRRTLVQYSSMSSHAIMGFLGAGLTVDFTAEDTTLTMKFKTIYGVAPELLSSTQANALETNNLNVFVKYQNGASIIEQGTMVNGDWFDEVHGLDWLQNYLQTGQFNLLTRVRKIPQTNAGVTQQMAQLESDLEQGVRNGLIAPGVWNAAGFGQLKMGDTLPKGYYTYAPPVESQSQADRDDRKPITIQTAIKLSGAFHGAHVIVNVNR